MPTNSFAPGVARMFLTNWGARLYAWRARRRGFQTEITDNGKYQTRELGGRYSVSIWKDDTSWMNQPRFGGEL